MKCLVEKAVLGWKEFELELLRDANDNVVYHLYVSKILIRWVFIPVIP